MATVSATSHTGEGVTREERRVILASSVGTIFVMGLSTFAVGLLPTFSTQSLPFIGPVAGIGWTAPILLVTLRLLQGLALGGEYGGAATYVAEHARTGERGYATSWIQTTATIGFFLSLFVIGACRFYLFDAKAFAE